MLRSITKPRVFYKNCGNVYSFGKSINSVSSKLIKRSYVSGSNYLRNANTPPLPSYFSNPTQSPSSSTLQSSENTSSGNNSSPAHDRPRVFLDLTVLIGFGLFAYMAFDNYNARITLEKKLYEHSLLQVKAISNAQLAFNNARRKRETQILQERAFIQKREMKMLLHIALLRKQLADAKMESADIDSVIAEYEKTVKMETSLSQVSGQNLWVIDDSALKEYMPNVHDYDQKK